MIIKRSSFLKLTLALALVVPLTTMQAGEPKKLQECIELPSAGKASIGIGYSSVSGWTYNESKAELLVHVDALKQQLKGNATDANSWFRIAQLYGCLEDTKSRDLAYQEAARFYREQLQQHPHDEDVLTRLARAECNLEKDCKETERMQQVVQQAPDSALAWRTLAGCLRMDALRVVGFGASDTTQGKILHLLATLIRVRPSKEQMAEFDRLVAKSDDCYERAIKLAPDEAELYVDRGMNRWVVDAFTKAIHGLLTDSSQLETAMLNEQAIADFDKAATLAPDDFRPVALAMYYQTIFRIYQSNGDETLANKFFADSKSPLALNVERMKKNLQTDMSRDANKGAAFLYARFFLVNSQCPEMEQILRFRLKHHPADDFLESILATVLADDKRYKDLIALHQTRLERQNTPQNRIRLAKAYALDGQQDKALQEAENAIQQDAGGLRSNMMAAALLLKYQATEESWKRAGTLLETASQATTVETDEETKADLYLLQAIQSGMMGDRDQAERHLSKALRLNPKSPKAIKVTQAITSDSP